MKKFIRTEEVQATEAILKGGNIYLPTDATPQNHGTESGRIQGGRFQWMRKFYSKSRI